MLHRRQILKSGAAAAALAAVGTPLAHAATTSGADLDKLFDQFMTENLDMSPIGATFLGVDTGARAKQRGEVDDNSLAGIAKQKQLTPPSQLPAPQRFRCQAADGHGCAQL